MTQVQTERVLVVPTDLFHRLGHFQGFANDVDRYLPELFAAAHTSFRPRAEVEEDPSYKQLIPYVIFRHTAGSESRIFRYTRGKGQGEGRLHSKRSIGIGGHISADDVQENSSGVYQEGMRRELDEEVVIESRYVERCVGLINDDQTEVGRVHLGVVHLFDVEEPAVWAREDDIQEAGFCSLDEVVAGYDTLESWSQICFDALFRR